MNGPTVADRAQPPTWEQRAIAWIVGASAVLGLIGFVLSFENVADRVEPYVGSRAPLVPLGVDAGIAVITGLDLLMARWKMRTRWLRFFPWSLVGVTVALNVSGEPELVGKLTHAVMPLLWVVVVESGAHALRVWTGMHDPRSDRMDRIRSSRWLLAPVSTVRLRRWMVLWEERSYTRALAMWQEMLLSRCDLIDEHGRWRKVPKRDRIAWKLGRIAPAATAQPEPVSLPVAVDTGQTPVDTPPSESPRGRGKPEANGDLDSAAEKLAAELKSQGKRVTRQAMLDGLRAAGWKLASDRGGELARRFG